MRRIIPFPPANAKRGRLPPGALRRKIRSIPFRLLDREGGGSLAAAYRLIRLAGEGDGDPETREASDLPVRKGQIRRLNNGRDAGGFRAPWALVLDDPAGRDGRPDAGPVRVVLILVYAGEGFDRPLDLVLPAWSADNENIRLGQRIGVVEKGMLFEYGAELLSRSPCLMDCGPGFADDILPRCGDLPEDHPGGGLIQDIRHAEAVVRDAFLEAARRRPAPPAPVPRPAAGTAKPEAEEPATCRALPFPAPAGDGAPPSAGACGRPIRIPLSLGRFHDGRHLAFWMRHRLAKPIRPASGMDPGPILPVRKGQIRRLNDGRDAGGFRAPWALVLDDPCEDAASPRFGLVPVALLLHPVDGGPRLPEKDVEELADAHFDGVIMENGTGSVIEGRLLFDYPAERMLRSPCPLWGMDAFCASVLAAHADPELDAAQPDNEIIRELLGAEEMVRDAFLEDARTSAPPAHPEEDPACGAIPFAPAGAEHREAGASPPHAPCRRIFPMPILLRRHLGDYRFRTYARIRLGGLRTDPILPPAGSVPVRRGQIRTMNNGMSRRGCRAPHVLVISNPDEDGRVLVAMAYLSSDAEPATQEMLRPLMGEGDDLPVRNGDACGFVEAWNAGEYAAGLLERSPVLIGDLEALADDVLDQIAFPADAGEPEDALICEFRLAELAVLETFLHGR